MIDIQLSYQGVTAKAYWLLNVWRYNKHIFLLGLTIFWFGFWSYMDCKQHGQEMVWNNLKHTHTHKDSPHPRQTYVIECACCCSVSGKQNRSWILGFGMLFHPPSPVVFVYPMTLCSLSSNRSIESNLGGPLSLFQLYRIHVRPYQVSGSCVCYAWNWCSPSLCLNLLSPMFSLWSHVCSLIGSHYPLWPVVRAGSVFTVSSFCPWPQV